VTGKVEMIGGDERRPIVLVPYDPRWRAGFADEKARIEQALGGGAQRVAHIGSTAVPGLRAKPIIDIQLSVADADDEDAYLPALSNARYVLRVREPAHRMLRTPSLDVHVHVCSAGSDWERRHLLFRDWLRVSVEDRQRYQDTKEALARQDWPTMNDYADAKTSVVQEITLRAEEWARVAGWSVAGSSPG
jgi:GrpB-like predicted nucleotidyltransferase (UPF0157 family)